jgi:hypothetical protein
VRQKYRYLMCDNRAREGDVRSHGESRRIGPAALLVLLCAWPAAAQTVAVTRNTNLRTEQSSAEPPTRLLTPAEPPLDLLEPLVQDGYYHVRTSAGEEGYVWARNVSISVTPAASSGSTTIRLGPGVPGAASMVGCGDGLWQHVYNPTRLIVKQDCLTVTGTMVDATANQATHQPDGVRHEPDGDTHGWLQVDPPFASLINAGNTSVDGGNGNLIFEIVCHFAVTQADAKPACAGFANHTTIPPIGAHVAVTGTFVTEQNHLKWNEIHPVSSIKVQ